MHPHLKLIATFAFVALRYTGHFGRIVFRNLPSSLALRARHRNIRLSRGISDLVAYSSDRRGLNPFLAWILLFEFSDSVR